MRFALQPHLIPEPLLSTSQLTYKISEIPTIPEPSFNPSFTFNPNLQRHLSGKQLLLEDLPFSLEEIQLHYQNGYIAYRPALKKTLEKYECMRCGTKDWQWFASYPCSRCGENCVYCRKCIMMGRISSCTPLICWLGPSPQENDSGASEPILHWQGQLSQGQEEASRHVVQAISTSTELLVWAVCGAGKTEVLFKGIEYALTKGDRVCIATPRTDVVLELTPRIKAVFPGIEVASLFGGSEDRHKYAAITISTTHQLQRFYHAFDTMIVDEVDAFPYSMDESLQYAVQQARKPHSTMIYLTATPSQAWQRDCRVGKRQYVTIPARYHRQPLPVPVFLWCGNWEKQLERNSLPSNLKAWVEQRLKQGKQVLVFAPKIRLMEKMLPLFRQLHPKTEMVHAEDPIRKEKVGLMRNKEIPLLVTTTILERGVTFPNIDVAIIGTEDAIFTESALVQIAGRAGRSAQFPTGDVVFFHHGRTEAMVRARKQITTMNQQGLKRGLLDR